MEDNNSKNFTFDFEALERCPLCQGAVLIPNGKVRWYDIDFWYVICPECGLKFMNPRPTRESYKEFYKNLFWEQKIKNTGFHQEGQMWQTKRYKWDNKRVWDSENGRKNRMEKHREQRAKTIIPVVADAVSLNENSRILEVGCGFGVTLDEFFKKCKCHLYGIEPSDEAQKTIKEFENIEILGRYAEDLEEISKKELKFDAIIFSHTLENLIHPFNVIKFATDSLKKNGVIYIQTPNLLTFDQMNPYHPYIFSKQSLGLLVKKAGLEYKVISEAIDKMLAAICFKSNGKS